MGLIRLFAGVFLLLATLSAAGDITRVRAGSVTAVASLEAHLKSLAPQSMAASQAFVSKAAHPAVWDQVVGRFLRLPATLVLAVVGGGLAWIGRRRRGANIVAN
ncbi:MAG: hypothetical protein KGP27_00385 [Hyphomicrobiales bacterium]|nr:hypothetical protein [Hyphomicrobiales bacterium]